jgi:hypothetical protein
VAVLGAGRKAYLMGHSARMSEVLQKDRFGAHFSISAKGTFQRSQTKPINCRNKHETIHAPPQKKKKPNKNYPQALEFSF